MIFRQDEPSRYPDIQCASRTLSPGYLPRERFSPWVGSRRHSLNPPESRPGARNRHSRELAFPSIERQWRIEAWIVTDTGFRTIRKRLTSRSPIPGAMSMLSADTPTTLQLDCI
jgi:hypothetical protein